MQSGVKLRPPQAGLDRGMLCLKAGMPVSSQLPSPGALNRCDTGSHKEAAVLHGLLF